MSEYAAVSFQLGHLRLAFVREEFIQFSYGLIHSFDFSVLYIYEACILEDNHPV